MKQQQISILIIDQSVTSCTQMKAILNMKSKFQYIYTVQDLHTALKILRNQHVDLVLLDVLISGNEQQTALQRILAEKELPVILLVSPIIKQTTKTINAISDGAIDFIKKIDTRMNELETSTSYKHEIWTKIEQAMKAQMFHSVSKNAKVTRFSEGTSDLMVPDIPMKEKRIIAVGASTGGPKALHHLIQQIPKSFSPSILIAQHMPRGFTASLAARLNSIGTIQVKEATHGETINKGTAYVAPGNYHMQVSRNRNKLKIKLSQDNEDVPRPSVDILFRSIAKLDDFHKMAVVLTGMGRDGTKGIIELKAKDNSAVILAESKETAVIDGMPKSAIKSNLVTKVLRIENIGRAITEHIQKRGN